jgi:hypothetical protein
MESFKRIILRVIESAEDRLAAVQDEVIRVQNRIYPSPGSQKLLDFVREAAAELNKILHEQQSVVHAGLLTSAELDVRLHRYVELVPLFHELVGLVEGSDVHHSPGQLIVPLRRYVKSVIPDAEIIVSSKPELNYSIQEISRTLKQTFAFDELKNAREQLPELLFLLNIPAAESGHILIHATVSHELGHALYDQHKMAEKLLPNVKIRDDLIKQLVTSLSASNKQPVPPLTELLQRQQITSLVTRRITQWLIELSADSIGLELFGPALYFAGVHLLTSLNHIESCSESHPPTKLRVKLMSRILKKDYPLDLWDGGAKSFFQDWDDISGTPLILRTPVDHIAAECLNSDATLDLIAKAVAAVIPQELKYTHMQLRQDVSELVPLLLELIPAGELGPLDKSVAVKLPSIINAGWHIYLSRFDTFKSKLHSSEQRDSRLSAKKLHELILKSLEISETKSSWKEAVDASQRRKNT